MSSEKKSEYVWKMQTGAECEMSVPRNINSAPPASFVTYISRRLPFAKRIVSLRGGKQLAPTLISEFMNIRFSSGKE
jgi:hypothetical protein